MPRYWRSVKTSPVFVTEELAGGVDLLGAGAGAVDLLGAGAGPVDLLGAGSEDAPLAAGFFVGSLVGFAEVPLLEPLVFAAEAEALEDVEALADAWLVGALESLAVGMPLATRLEPVAEFAPIA